MRPEPQPANSSARATTSRLKIVLRALLGSVGLLTALAGLIVAGLAVRDVWISEKAAGEVSALAAGLDGGAAPVVVFNDSDGKRQQFTGPMMSNSERYAPGTAVTVLYDPRDPFSVRLFDAVRQYAPGLLLIGTGALALLIAASLAPGQTAPVRPRPAPGERRTPEAPDDPQRFQFHPLNAVAAAHYVAELDASASARKVRIADAAKALGQERIPVVLAQVLAHAAVIAYAADPLAYIAAHCPRFTDARLAARDGARALLFTFEGQGVAVFTCAALSGPVTGVMQRLTPYAGARRYVPDDTVWDATPRLNGPARAFDALRADLEAWAAAFGKRPEDQPPFLFTGHAMGGVLAQLAAYEFVKRGRSVAGVVTFGAPCAGGDAFRDEYANLGLDERTLACCATDEALSVIQGPFAVLPAGTPWRLARPPLESGDGEAATAQEAGSGVAAYALAVAKRADETGALPRRPRLQRLLLRFLSSAPAARDALLAYDLERCYVLPLSVLVARRFREVLAPQGTATEFATARQAFDRHCEQLRGRPASDGGSRRPFVHYDRLMARTARSGAGREQDPGLTASA